MSSLVNHYERVFLKAFGPAFKGRRYLIAVSGGLDSMVMAHVMCALLPPKQILIAHFNHNLRGQASEGDARFVERFAKKAGVSFLKGEGKGQNPSEAFLREERKNFLEEARRSHQCHTILTGHQANDNFETFMFRLIRGTGPEGLGSIPLKSPRYFRPQLEITRQQLEVFAQGEKIEFREDASNHSATYFRNRIRQRLVPGVMELSKFYGGEEAFYRRFNALTRDLREERALSRKRGKRLYTTLAVPTAFWVRCREEALRNLTSADRALFLRTLYKELTGESPTRLALSRLDSFCQSHQRALNLPRLSLERSLGFLFFQNAVHRRNQNLESDLTVEGSLLKSRRLGLVAELHGSRSLEARFFEPGDRLRRKKLKRLFWERKIPAPERNLIPLLFFSGSKELCWWPLEEGPQASLKKLDFPFTFISSIQHLTTPSHLS